MSDDQDRTASLMTPAKLAQLKVRPAAAASPAAWLDQLASDAGSGHVRRLLDVRRQLEAQVRERERDGAAAAAACTALATALQQLDFAAVQPRGWLARATGKGKEAAAVFRAQLERALRCAEDLGDEVRSLQKKQQAQAVPFERALLEADVELRAIDKIMDQGARWLQDMRNQLKTREAAGGDAAAQQQIAEDARRCELLVSRLKLLRVSNAAAQQALEHCRTQGERRATLATALRQLHDTEWQQARQRLAAVADHAAESGPASQGIEAAREERERVTGLLQQARGDCDSLQAQEQALADELAAWQAPLQAAS